MKFNLKKVLLGGATVAALGLALTSSTRANAEVREIRVGYLANIVMPQPLVGFQRGEYARRVKGVKFTGRVYPAGPEVMEALRAGVIDIAYTGPFPPLKAFVKDRDVILLAGAAKGGTELLVSKNSSIRSLRDLRGKKVAVNQAGSTVDAIVRFALLKAGLRPGRDVQIVEVEPAQQADALLRGDVDAVSAPAPWPSVVRTKGNGRALLNWRQIFAGGDYLQGVAFTTKKFANQNPIVLRRFVNAHKGITNDLNKNRARGNALVLAAWSKVTRKTLAPAVAKNAFASITFTNAATQAEFERDQNVAYQVGIVRKKGSLNGFIYR